MKLSSKVWSAVGVLLIALALAIWFVVVPSATKFPSKTNTTQHYSGVANLLDAQALGRGDVAHAFISNAPVTMDRTVKAVKTSGNTVVVTDNSTVQVATQTLTDDHTYSINRTNMLPTDPPNGQQVEHTDGYTVTLPIGPKGSGSSYRLNDNATQQAFPLNYRAAAKVHGRVNGQFDVPAGGQVKVPTLCGMFLGWRYLRSVCHAVGVAVGDDDGGVVQEPVEDAGGGGVFGEESSPLFEGPVAGDRE